MQTMRKTTATGNPSKASAAYALAVLDKMRAGLAKGRVTIKDEAEARAMTVRAYALLDLQAGGSARGRAGRIRRRMIRELPLVRILSEGRIRKIYLGTRNRMPKS